MPFWMSLSLWWEKRAEPWVKRNWHWLALVTGGLVLFILALAKKRPKVQVVSTELSGADQVKRDLEAKKLTEEAKLEGERDEAVQEAGEKRDGVVGDLIGKQKEVAADPPQGNDLTDYLKAAGRDVRQ